MNKAIIFCISFVGMLSLSLFENEQVYKLSDDSSVASILVALGDPPVLHQPNLNLDGVSAKRGEQIVKYGQTRSLSGRKTRKQSKHFVCTSCHNIVQEDPDLMNPNPEARLEYAQKKGIPFLQATTFYGIVNRTKFYNDDYFKKYGDLVDKARNDIRESIQLCAVECAQGRPLESWEIESIISYFWKLEYKVKDLELTNPEKEDIDEALNKNGDKENAISIIKSKYLDRSPAHMSPPPENRLDGYDVAEGDPMKGKAIYEISCKHCHHKERYSFFNLDDASNTFEHLTKHIPRYSRYSIYQVIRWGTSPIHGKKAYMPFYTREKMSDQQLEDLRAYISLKGAGGSLTEETME